MEENDINKLFDKFRPHLKEDLWSKFFYISLLENIWYDKINNLYYIGVSKEDVSILRLAVLICDYRKKEFFRNDEPLDYYIFLQEKGYEYGYISEYISNVKGFNDFIILKYNQENLNNVKSLSRNYKINKITD